MGDNPLNITFALTERNTWLDPYWLRFEIVEDKSEMTVGEAADIIDALYDVSICGKEEIPEPEIKPTPTADDWTKAYALIPAMPGCEGREAVENGDPGAYDVQVRVYRSHRGELYKLVLTNGMIGTIKHTETRVELTFDLEDESHLTLDQPIVGAASIGWQDIDGPEIKRKGNTVYWEGSVTGVLRAEFNTEFDLVDIHVNGIKNTSSQVVIGTDHTYFGTGWYSGDEDGTELKDVQDTECTLLGFYHYQFEELQLHKPKNDNSVDSGMADEICNGYGSTTVIPGDPFDKEAECKRGCTSRYEAGSDALNDCLKQCEEDAKRCYRTGEITKICTCGGDEEVVRGEEIPARCPKGYADGANIGDGGESTEYVDCGPDADIANAGFYEEHCCVVPEEGISLPVCKDHYSPFSGGAESNNDDIKGSYGEDAIIVSVGPAKGSCGQTIVSQDIDSKDCCDEIPDIVDNGSDASIQEGGVVRFTGGLPPYHVTDENDADFWIVAAQCDYNTETELWEGEFSISVPTDPCAGNSVSWNVEDECSSLGGDMGTENTYEAMKQFGRIVATPGSDVSISFTGGVGPFTWGDSQFLTFSIEETSGNSNVAAVHPDMCGSDSVYVTDACGNGIDIIVNSTDGQWVYVPCVAPYCCDNSEYGGGCMSAEGETWILGLGTCYETEVPGPTGYLGDMKGTFTFDICAYQNTICDDDYWCEQYPETCPGLGGSTSFECHMNRGSRAHGVCGLAAGIESYYVAIGTCLENDLVNVPCDGIVSFKNTIVPEVGDPYQQCSYFLISLWGGILRWEC